MPIEIENIKIGQRYTFREYDEENEITIIGFDPYEGKWVAASQGWVLGLSHIDDYDVYCMDGPL